VIAVAVDVTAVEAVAIAETDVNRIG
jgi:hypothetical protein